MRGYIMQCKTCILMGDPLCDGTNNDTNDDAYLLQEQSVT